MATVIAFPLFAAAGYSLVYLLGGGGVFGAIVIFFVAKMMGKSRPPTIRSPRDCVKFVPTPGGPSSRWVSR